MAADEALAQFVAQVDDFLALQARRWTEATIGRYRWFLLNLAHWLEELGIPLDVEQITERDLLRWLDARMQWAPSTQYTATIACRTFFRWALGRERSPAERLQLPRRSYAPQRTLDEQAVMRILGALDTSTVKGKRDTAIVLLLLDSGLRASELCRLRVDHVDLARRGFDVRIKGGRWAKGVFSPYTAAALDAWLQVRPEIARPEAIELFVAIGGLTRGQRMTNHGLRVIFRQIGQRIGMHFSPHDFRRTFATMALKGGASSRLVQIAGRWSSMAMVERYTQGLTAEDFDGYSPVQRVLGLEPDEQPVVTESPPPALA